MYSSILRRKAYMLRLCTWLRTVFIDAIGYAGFQLIARCVRYLQLVRRIRNYDTIGIPH